MNATMVSAAKWADIPNVDLVHEPEAAAAFCLLDESVKQVGSFNPGSEQAKVSSLFSLNKVTCLY